MLDIGDLVKYDDGDYSGIGMVKAYMPNNLEVELFWITAKAPNGKDCFNNTIFSYKFLQDTTFWRKIGDP